MNAVPTYLKDYETLYTTDPRAAAVQWFRDAKFGLFVHYGLYSLLGGEWPDMRVTNKGAEWIRWTAPIPLDTYAALQADFTAEKFDADAICKLAISAGMRYVNLTTRHHDGFCLWDTATTDFSSVHAPARRDLVREMAEACQRHGLGCFLYISHGREWWHPDGPDTGVDEHGYNASKPECPEDAGRIHFGDDVQLDRYLDLIHAQIMEICRYPDIAGIWLDGVGSFLSIPDGVKRSRCQDLYDKIHAVSPHILVSYKQGLSMTEDFFAPERGITEAPDSRPYEICTTLQPRSWGYKKADDGKHQNADWVMEQLAAAAAIPANLLLNTGPKGDGSVPDEDVRTLVEVGRRLRSNRC